MSGFFGHPIFSSEAEKAFLGTEQKWVKLYGFRVRLVCT